MRIAAAAWPLEWHADWDGYAAKLARWVDRAAADLLVFPEYAGMEAALTGRPPPDRPDAWLDRAAALSDRVLALHVDLARRRGVHILAGSLPVMTARGLVNRSHLVDPGGAVLWQDKQIPTPWERAHTSLVPGEPLMLAETGIGRIGILICHDAEFPLHARALDCDLLLVPACTDTARGATRVRVAARARALEGPCVSVLAQTLGEVPGCCFLDANSGRAGVYTPPDTGFPATGIAAESAPATPGWVRAEIAHETLARLKAGGGEVAIGRDWPGSEGAAPVPRRRLGAR